MSKLFITYLFSLALLASIVTPSYVSLMDVKCEISEIVDFGEEEENKGNESVNDFEVKICHSLNTSLLYSDLEKKKRISFYSKNYASYQKKLTSPPPELLA